jgi:asparagine synthase (glutamine-hydrolysing)
LQGADGIQRMIPHWNLFMNEMEKVKKSDFIAEYFDINLIQAAVESLRDNPQPQSVFSTDFKILMRSLIVYRFINKFL